jgi:signal transduction histidine kinase
MIRLLAVDDSEQNLLLLQLQLRGRDLVFDTARDGAQALQQARRRPPDLVICDLLMPVMDGYTLLRHWRADPRLAAVPFIVYTATYTDPRDEQLARELGADGFLAKPAEPAALLQAIDAALGAGPRAARQASAAPVGETVLQSYSEVLVAKLEDKALALQRANRELRDANRRAAELSQQLVELREAQSARISRELHDELGQALTGLKLDLGWLQRRLERLDEAGMLPAVQQRLRAMGQAVDATVAATRRICTELRPAVLDDLGLAAAIEWQARELGRRASIDIALELPPQLPALDAAATTAVFRIVQELLTNVARHAGARRVGLRLRADADALHLQVQDDGRGFDAGRPAAGGGLGLPGIRERAALRGGAVDVRSAPGQGTTVAVRLPLAAPEARR